MLSKEVSQTIVQSKTEPDTKKGSKQYLDKTVHSQEHPWITNRRPESDHYKQKKNFKENIWPEALLVWLLIIEPQK